MQITITATLTEEQINILAKAKGYQPTVTESQEQEDGTFQNVEIPNGISESEFVKNVYQNMIVNDTTNVFLSQTREAMAEQVRQAENEIRTLVSSSITSSIE